ncbi:MAG: protein kinase [Planctomycetes bacterium]|nr:protein kinase [Planctomycetota bacterium]
MTDSQDELVEALAEACLGRIADGSDGSVEDVCREHPELIDRVRRVLARLQSLGLVEPAMVGAAQRFGEFRLLHKLGEGGMGVVWLAEQPRLHRNVALKLLRPGLQLQARLRARFRREVQALSKLDHPNICTVYEAGDVDGSPYLAMRYVEGDSLQQLLDRRRRERRVHGASTSSRELYDLLHLVEKVALALHASHSVGVVHRDVKPGNILIDHRGEPVLVDFGLAHDDDPSLSSLTLTGEPLGTPTYMAPEQIAGHGSVDCRTDVYALGVILYECATLQPPFAAPSRERLYRCILHDPVPDPRRRGRSVGRELRAVLEKALAKEPRSRFSTALELAEELGRVRRHEPVRTRSIGPVLRGVRWCQRNPAATVVLAVVTAALLVCGWALRRSMEAETGLRALALIAAAQQVAPQDPELAFKLQRRALALQDPADADPLVLASVQQTMFRLHDYGTIRSEDGRFEWLQVSPDPAGRFVVVTGPQVDATLHRSDDGSLLYTFPCLVNRQRPVIAFAHDGSKIAVCDDERRVLLLYGLDEDVPEPLVEFGARDGIRITKVAWSPRDRRLVLAYADGVASVWSSDGEHLRDLEPRDVRIAVGGRPWRAAAFVPDGRVVAAGAIWSADYEPEVLLTVAGAVATGVDEVNAPRRGCSPTAFSSAAPWCGISRAALCMPAARTPRGGIR